MFCPRTTSFVIVPKILSFFFYHVWNFATKQSVMLVVVVVVVVANVFTVFDSKVVCPQTPPPKKKFSILVIGIDRQGEKGGNVRKFWPCESNCW